MYVRTYTHKVIEMSLNITVAWFISTYYDAVICITYVAMY